MDEPIVEVFDLDARDQAPTQRQHRCRFEVACSCWYGVPCDPWGASMRTMERRETRD